VAQALSLGGPEKNNKATGRKDDGSNVGAGIVGINEHCTAMAA